MQKFYAKLLAILMILLVMPATTLQAWSAQPRKGVVRVKLQAEAAKRVGNQRRAAAQGATLSTGVTALDASVKQLKATSMQRVFPYAEKFEAQRAAYGLDRWYEITFDESVSPIEAKKLLAETPGVQRADYVVPMVLKEGTGDFIVQKAPAKATSSTTMPFDDPRLSSQWHYYNDGSLSDAVAGIDINLFEAWKVETGKSNVIVAVIDGGIDYSHEDLAANVYINETELNGTEGVDDDGNGYVDDIYGYNFVTNTAEVYPHSHGTHVAGTVAAVNNNGIGVAGVAGGDGTDGSGVKLLSCQVFDSRSGTAGEGDFAKAIVYAAENGASIAQCSWGWEDPDYYEQDVLDAIDYFTDMARTDVMAGGLCIFAVGNNGDTGNYYPACYSKVLSVTAITADGKPASYSNYGSWVSVAAPGGDTTYNSALGVLSTLPSNQYGYSEGTSMATPHVSGIAALVLSKYGSSTFTNTALKQQLVTAVNDLYEINPTVEGLYGSGYIDAAKALVTDTGEAPDAVTDFTLDATQEEIVVEWTIPNSSEGSVNHHMLYYSTEAFTAESDLTEIPSIIVDTQFEECGSTYSYEITDLKPLTTYYVALSAVDRWGNASALSEVKTATTNAGPQMTLDGTSVTLNIDASTSPTASGTFTIGNSAEGLLKWSSWTKSVKKSSYYYSTSAPNPGKIVAYSGKIGTSSVKTYSVVDMEEYDPSEYPINMKWYESVYAYIGDSDPTVPNSLAQMFTVDASTYPDGFNLTHVTLEGSNGSDPTIQIYRGTTINSASLVYEFTPSYWYYGGQTALSEQQYFEAGESFWVVYHFPASEDIYPLGIGVAVDDYNDNYSYMSTDNGETWTRLSDVLKNTSFAGNTYAFSVKAISQNPDWSSLLVLDPSEGTVRNGETQVVTVSNDGQSLINGTYNAKIGFTTNESGDNDLSVSVTIKATGATPEITGPKVVDFGSLLVGQEKTLSVEVFNKGYGTFTSSSWGSAIYSSAITSSSENFSGPSYVSGGFPARNYTTFDVTYAPQSAGSHSGTITFKDVTGVTYSVVVQGVATEPAEIYVEPTTIEVGDLEVGADATTAEFTITNNGKYPLEYVLPKFSSETVDGVESTDHKFGYTYLSNIDGAEDFEYDDNPDLINATEITSQFSDDVYISNAIDLGFDFPYFGKTYSQVYVTSFGGVLFAQPEKVFRSPLDESSYGVTSTGLISAYGTQLPMAKNSKVEYAKQDGKFVVKFTDVMGLVYDTDYTPISFHITLSSNGDIEVFYDDYEPYSLFQEGTTLFLGLNDPDNEDPLIITSSRQYNNNDNLLSQSIETGTAVKFVAPKPYFVQNVEPADGIVLPGESQTLTATLQATDDMNAGETFNNIAISSNDPDTPTTFVRFNATITGDDLVPVATIDSQECAFGEVFRTADAVRTVTLKNSGRDVLTISSAAIEGDGFSATLVTPLTIEAGMSKDIAVTLDTETSGEYTGKLTVETDGGNHTVALSGTVIGTPVLGLSYEEINETVESGTTINKPLTVTNNGDEPMTFALVPNELLSFTVETDDNTSTSYTYTASVDDSSVEMDWIDIVSSGESTRHDFTYFDAHDFYEVELPFAFPFYGTSYTKMYVYNTGFISFTERDDEKAWPEPPADFPAGSTYTNVIAPYWGLHSMDVTSTAGVYHLVSDDQVVVSFMEYGNSMNIGVCFQVILKADGTFKFQYKALDDNSVIYSLFGLGGISNLYGTEGIKLPARTMQFGCAVNFAPIVTNTLDPGASKTIDIDIPITQMAGEYTSTLEIDTNVPHNEEVEIPITLTVTGTPEPVWPEDIIITHPVGYTDSPDAGPITALGAPYEAYFTIENTGTASFTIESISYESPQYEDIYWGDMCDAVSFWYYGDSNGIDYWSDEPTGSKTWLQYNPNDEYSSFSPITVGPDAAQFSIIPNTNEVEAEWTIPITFGIGGIDGVTEYTFNVTFIQTAAPKISIVEVVDSVEKSVKEIVIDRALPDSIYTRTITIKNTGEGDLNFSFDLDETGEGDSSSDDDSGIDAWSISTSSAPSGSLEKLVAVKTLATGASDNAYDTPQGVEYNDALYYPVPDVSTVNIYSFGAFNKYDDLITSTCYTSPEGGINITDIYTAVYYPGVTNFDITATIVKGKNPRGSTVLGTASYHADEMPESATYIVLKMEKETFIPEGVNFCVVITYPKGQEYATFLVEKADDVVAERYMAYTDTYSWIDPATLYQDTYGSLGWIATCVERTEGSFWAKVVGGDTASYVIAPNESQDIEIEFVTDRAPLETGNKAVLVMKSDDPDNSTINFPLTLNKNRAPEITAESSTVLVPENSTVETTVTITEPEGETFKLTFNDSGSLAKVVSATNDATVDSTTITGTGSTVITLALTADYGDAGSYEISFNAVDVNGVDSESEVSYVVEHVNRAPEFDSSAEEVTVAEGATSGVISFADYFTDPDGDDMTFEIEVVDTSVAQNFNADASTVFYGVKVGNTVAKITATDANGASTTAELPVVVTEASGVADITADAVTVGVYPNPAVDVIYVTADFTAAGAELSLYTTAGSLALKANADLEEGTPSAVNIGHLAAGTYLLVVKADGITPRTALIVKR